MIVEKPNCLNHSCQYKGYLKKTKDGWICPKCKCEYYEIRDYYISYPYPYPLPEVPYYPEPYWKYTTGDPLPDPNITIC